MNLKIKDRFNTFMKRSNEFWIDISIFSTNTFDGVKDFVISVTTSKRGRLRAYSSVKKSVKKILLVFVQELRIIVNAAIDNIESLIVMALATMGVGSLISRIPFKIPLPSFVESTMFVPVLSVMVILLLLYFIEKHELENTEEEEGGDIECAISAEA